MITGMLIGGASVWAMGPHHGHIAHAIRGLGPHAPLRTLIHGEVGRLAALQSDLGVTDEQRDQIHAVLQSYRGDFAPLVRDLVEIRRSLHDAVVSPDGDVDAITRSAAELGDAVAAVSLLAADVVREIRPLLTADQIEQLEAFSENRQAAVDRWFAAHVEGAAEVE